MAEICSVCESQFGTTQDYVAHTCEKTGFTPAQVEHQDALTGGHFSVVAASALERGSERKATEEQEAAEGIVEWNVSGRFIREEAGESIDKFVSAKVKAKDKAEAEARFLEKYADPDGKARIEGFEAEGG